MPKPSRRGSLPNDATCRAFGNSSRCVPVAAEGEVRSFAMGCACVSVRCADAVLAAPRSSSRAEIRLLNSILAFSAARVVALALKSESARRALGDGEKAHESSLAFVALPRDERKIARVRDSQVLRPPYLHNGRRHLGSSWPRVFTNPDAVDDLRLFFGWARLFQAACSTTKSDRGVRGSVAGSTARRQRSTARIVYTVRDPPKRVRQQSRCRETPEPLDQARVFLTKACDSI